jgi:hypothetical protein
LVENVVGKYMALVRKKDNVFGDLWNKIRIILVAILDQLNCL